jgi:hypothetical protein
MKKALVGLLFVMLSSVAWALPTEQQVQDAVRQGQYTQAQSMMAEVVAAKPTSAKAHYVYAELLAHNGAFGKAAEEAGKAKQIDPNIGFTDPAKFRSFEETLQREQNQSTTRSVAPRAAPTSYNTVPAPAASGGIPGWVWLVGLVILAIVLWRGFARSRAMGGTPAPAAGYGPGGMNPGYGPAGYGPGGMPGAQGGSGLLGTGLAVAGGVAGGMLLGEMLHGREGNAGGGGLISDAYADNGAARDLENRPVDFGNGNDWDSGSGGGIDLGGGGDSGGSWE